MIASYSHTCSHFSIANNRKLPSIHMRGMTKMKGSMHSNHDDHVDSYSMLQKNVSAHDGFANLRKYPLVVKSAMKC